MEPAESDILPPLLPAPAVKLTSPALPLLDEPVDSDNEPVFPHSDMPVLI
jgi:hypothetical protein